MEKRYLVLEDGTIFEGYAFGSKEESLGEVVFSTGMTGYQEIISNPSACGQIIAMTYPAIGNYGVNRDDYESIELALNGLVVRRLEEIPSNFRSGMSLGELMELKGIPGIQNIDTRALTNLLREKGSLKGMLTKAGEDVDREKVVTLVENYEVPTDLVDRVSTKKSYPSPGVGKRVVLIDYGMKHGLLRELNKRNCDVVVVPHDASKEMILSLFPDGIVLSNGPGNPEDVPYAIETLQSLIGEVPMFGIGLGHQLFALAKGARVEKMKHGQYGSNHPVKDLATNRTELTTQLHGYTVERASVDKTDLQITHIALNDQSVQGLESEKERAFTVQFHPEGSPGPTDSNHLFDRFVELMEEGKGIYNA